VIRFQFVDDHRNTHEVKRMCSVLGIQRSSFYKWCASRPARAARQAADDALCERIEHHFEFWDHTYGYRRITAELADDPHVDEPVNRKRVARLMRNNGMVGIHLRKPKTTTISDPDAQVFADLVGRDFSAAELGTTYVGDITYLPYGDEGKFLYLATVIDLYSRRIVGWSIADHMRSSLVEDALQNAVNNRETLEGAIFHSDHGRQYTHLQIYDGHRLVATHPRVASRGGHVVDLDHYLEVLKHKPGALPGSTALAAARASGAFSPTHDAFWAETRKVNGDSEGTKELIDVLLLHRALPADAVIAGIRAALKIGAVSAEVVAIEARRHAPPGGATTDRHPVARTNEQEQKVVSLTQRRLTDPGAVIAGLPPDTRPVPSVAAYDQLLPRRGAPSPRPPAPDIPKASTP
jgi:hypothetical protein